MQKKQFTQDGSLQNTLDELFSRTAQYRNSNQFNNLLRFCGRFKHLAPYNAMMVNIQKPNSRYVLTASQWAMKYNRRIKPDVPPMIILQEFGPINFVYDIGDTEYPYNPESAISDREQELLEYLSKPYEPRQKVDERLYKLLTNNLVYHAICLADFSAGAGYSGKISCGQQYLQEILIPVVRKKNNEKFIPYQSLFRISINSQNSMSTNFCTILHELGHLFCHHLPLKLENTEWEVRRIGQSAAEFEAESVSWLICQRLGIESESEKYLAHYAANNQQIPDAVSTKYIFDAVNHIWPMLDDKISYKEGIPYKYDKSFQQFTKSFIAGKVKQNMRQGELFN